MKLFVNKFHGFFLLFSFLQQFFGCCIYYLEGNFVKSCNGCDADKRTGCIELEECIANNSKEIVLISNYEQQNYYNFSI